MPYRRYDCVYRGVDYEFDKDINDVIEVRCFISTTKEKRIAMDYVGKNENGDSMKGSVIEIEGAWGYELNEISMNDNDEVILEPGITLIVNDIREGDKSIKTYVMCSDSESSILLNDIPLQ